MAASLDRDIQARVTEIMGQGGVKGVLIADNLGLCVAAQGELTSKAAGFLTSLAQRAQDIVGSDAEPPTISVEADSCNIYVRKEGPLTVAVLKSTVQ